MIDETLLRSLGFLVIACALCAMVMRLLRLPALVGYLAAGLLLGPVTGLLEISPQLDLIAETGIVLLLFLVGLELSFDKVRVVGRAAALTGTAQVLLTTIAGFLLCRALGFSGSSSLLLAIALTLSSTVVVVKLLDEKRQFDSAYGRISIGVLLVQDLFVIVLLTILGAVQPGTALAWPVLLAGVARALGGMAVLIAGAWLVASWLLRRPFAWASRYPETLFIWSLSWCFVVLFVAHLLHLSHEIGAFIAGITLAQFPHNEELHRRVHPLMNFFVAVFFVSIGARMTPGPALAHWQLVLGLCAFVLLGKFLIITLIGQRLRLGAETAFLAGVTLAQMSEFSFVLVAMGVRSGLLDSDTLSITGAVGLITIAVSSCLIAGDARLLAWLRRIRREPRDRVQPAESIATASPGPSIVVGMNTLGRELVRRLAERGEPTVAIDTDPVKLLDLPGRTIVGSAEHSSVLEEAGLAHARLLVSALQIEEANELLAYRCRVAGVRCSILGIDLSVVDTLLEMDVAYLMIPKIDGVKLQNRELQRMGILPS